LTEQRRFDDAVRYIDPFRDARALRPITTAERGLLRQVNQKIAARPSLRAIVDYLFDSTQELIPCDRIGLAFVDPEGHRVTSYYNRAAYEPLLIDRDYSQDLRDSSLRAVLENGLPRIIRDLEEYLEQHPRSGSTRLLVKEGVRSSLTCPLSVEGRIVGFIFRSSRTPDMYHSKHIELQMAIAERLSQAVEKAWRIEQLEQANFAYMQMLGFVSHELKSPVASMVTDARLIADGYLGEVRPEQKEKLERLIRKGDHLLGLVREYLDLARVEGSELEARLQPSVDFRGEVLDDAADVVRPHIEARGMRLIVVTPGEPRPRVCCDPALMRVVLTNLLDNAAKYGYPQGPVEVTLAAGDPAVLSIRDHGQGVDPAEVDHIFDRFVRGGQSRERAGSGLGLAIVRQVAHAHGGTVAVETPPDGGARFVLTLPGAAVPGA